MAREIRSVCGVAAQPRDPSSAMRVQRRGVEDQTTPPNFGFDHSAPGQLLEDASRSLPICGEENRAGVPKLCFSPAATEMTHVQRRTD